MIFPLFAVSLIFLPPTEDTFLVWMSRLYRLIVLYLVVALVVFLGILYYVQELYPRLPQEFGGVRPRCVYLDVTQAQLSEEMRIALLTPNAAQSTQPVIRSIRVDELYVNDSGVIIRANNQVHEITKDVIVSKTTCD